MSTMQPEHARQILMAMPQTSLSEHRLASRLELIESDIGDNQDDGAPKIELDGYFTADQLEAIATWMRNPGQVAGA